MKACKDELALHGRLVSLENQGEPNRSNTLPPIRIFMEQYRGSATSPHSGRHIPNDQLKSTNQITFQCYDCAPPHSSPAKLSDFKMPCIRQIE